MSSEHCGQYTGCKWVFWPRLHGEVQDLQRRQCPSARGRALRSAVQTVQQARATGLPVVRDADENAFAQGELEVDEFAWIEHISGPKCNFRQAYSGHEISCCELNQCHSVQCLMPKQTDWIAQSDDLMFEKSGKFYLTNTVAEMGRDNNPNHDRFTFEEVSRHGETDVDIEDAELHFEPGRTPLPVHPACFEIFVHLSQQHLGRIDTHGLINWFFLDECLSSAGAYSKKNKLKRNHDLQKSSGDIWNHVSGAAHLIANPVSIPEWDQLLQNAVHSEGDGFDVSASPFTSQSSEVSPKGDVFTTLPGEIKMEILEYLDSVDIANLRLASREYRHPPTSLWHHLLKWEMPWVYEAWSDDSVCQQLRQRSSPFRRTETLELALEIQSLPLEMAQQRWHKAVCDHTGAFKRIVDSNQRRMAQGETWEDWCVRSTSLEAEYGFKQMKPAERQHLPLHLTNWHQLYCKIKALRKNMPGLRNRQRIWTEVEEIVHQIKHYRQTGVIKDERLPQEQA